MAPRYPKHLSRRDFMLISAMALAASATGCGSARVDLAGQAAKVGAKERRPVVVIGAGLGGLTAAAYLARDGFPVSVVEQHNVPGGYATSFDRAGGRFSFEVALHQTSATGGSSRRVLRELGLEGGLPLAAAPDLTRLITPEFSLTLPAADPQGCVERLSQLFPQQAQGIAAHFRDLLKVVEEVESLPDRMGPLDFASFPSRQPLLWEIRNMTLAQFLERNISDPKLRDLLAFQWGYYGLPPSKLSAFLYAVANGGFLKYGGHYYLPRSQALSDAMAGAVEKAGGRVIYERRAERILLAGGAVAGVELAGGERLPASAVMAGSPAPVVFGRMLPAGSLPADYQAKLNSYRPSLSSFIVWLGLNQEIRGKVAGYNTSLGLGGSPEEEYQAVLAGDVEKVGLGVAIYDNLHPGYSRPGTSTLMLMFVSGFEPWRRFEADYLAGRKEAYQREKERVAQAVIRRVEERLIPGLSSMIEVREAATPLTNLRYTGNPEGALYGYEQSLDNAFMNRLDNRTPIKGLYLASAWGNPGGGFTGAQMAGRQAYAKLLEDWS